jgi:hypothetical protein
MVKLFSVWNGTTINPRYQSMADIKNAVHTLNPFPRNRAWHEEWLIKAGEGGTWQSDLGDSHPLALSGPDSLQERVAQGVRYKLHVIPYVVIRGKPAWDQDEWNQITDCARLADRVVLNLEPGAQYWDGPTAQQELFDQYINPLLDQLSTLPSYQLEVCMIPRQWTQDVLGGEPCWAAWVSKAQRVSYECYDATAADLDVAASIARVQQWAADTGWGGNPEDLIPVVQQSRIGAWATTSYCKHGFEVWHLDGD